MENGIVSYESSRYILLVSTHSVIEMFIEINEIYFKSR